MSTYDPIIKDGIVCRKYAMKPKSDYHMDAFMERMLIKGVIRSIRRNDIKAYMPTFQIPKNGYRVITDCPKLDEFIDSTPFKGQSAYDVIRRMQDFKFVAKLDLKDAYYYIRLGTNIQKYLAFNYRGKDYTWTRLIQGISGGLTVFQRLLAAILKEYTPNVINYLDDVAIGADTMEELKGIYERILKTLKANG